MSRDLHNLTCKQKANEKPQIITRQKRKLAGHDEYVLEHVRHIEQQFPDH
jgi:hypothetical protein